jgi:hypothetical protein
MVRYLPDSIGAYQGGQNMNFKIRSSNEMLILNRSFMSFDAQEIGTLTSPPTAGTTLSSMGGQVFISQVYDTLSGLVLPTLKNYNLQQSVKLNCDTFERKAITARTEKYDVSSNGTGYSVANVCFPKTRFIIPIPTSLESADKVIPLNALTGWDINILLEQFSRAFTNGISGNNYQISNAELHCCMLTPTAGYAGELSTALNSSGSLKIPLQLCKSITTSLSPSTTQTVKLTTGYLSSLNSITNVVRKQAIVGKGTTATACDSFLTNTNMLASYYISINSQRFPRNYEVKISDPITGVEDPEGVMSLLSSFNTKLSSLTPFRTAITTPPSANSFTYYSFESNASFASGVPTADGILYVETTFNTVPAVGDYFDSFIEYSAILQIDANSVQLIIDV